MATTNSKHGLPEAPNQLERNFTATASNRVWASDINYVTAAEGWLYLAIIIDLFSRQVVGWSMQPHMNRRLARLLQCSTAAFDIELRHPMTFEKNWAAAQQGQAA